MQLDVYVEGEPDARFVATLRSLLPTSPAVEPIIELLPDEDWIAISQAGLDPIRAGRFFVHAAKDADSVPPHSIGLRIEAAQAFGTGHHETTAGCLRFLDRFADEAAAPARILDVGTGTAVLAIAAARLFPAAGITATDIDPVSIDVARENLAVNGVAEGSDAGEIVLLVADGMDDAAIVNRGPYDLILANILAQPLIGMAPQIAAAIATGGTLVLAGLLTNQAEAVIDAYRQQGLRLTSREENDGWPILALERPAFA